MDLGLIGPIRDRRLLSEYSLVLRSMEIEHGLTTRPDGFYFSVAARDVDRSVDALRSYDEENRDFVRRPAPRERLAYPDATRVGPLAMLVLAAFFALVTGPVASAPPGSLAARIFAFGTSDDRLVSVFGQWHRSITALTLHADAAHLVGNALAGAVFLTFLARRIGPGKAVFLALVAGTLGNLFNTALHVLALHQPHRSLGASTAVFAIVGLLTASQLVQNRARGALRWTDRVGPVVGGVALLAMLGASPHSDVWAHVLGFAAGVGLGVIARVGAPPRWPAESGGAQRAQRAYLAATVLAVAGAWVAAFLVH